MFVSQTSHAARKSQRENLFTLRFSLFTKSASKSRLEVGLECVAVDEGLQLDRWVSSSSGVGWGIIAMGKMRSEVCVYN